MGEPSPTSASNRGNNVHDMALSPPGYDPGRDDACLHGLSLCAGAGGLDLGLHIACPGYRTVGYVEREAYAAAALVARMENKALDPAPVWDDLTTFDGQTWRGVVDILTAGYPCQPFSVAGRRLGEADPRHLWPHVARIIRECDPPIVFLENVANHLRLGFPEVARELVDMGYIIAAGLFTASEVGAPHRRERLFILAVHDDNLADTDGERWEQAQCGQPQDCRSDQCQPYVDDADGPGLQGWIDQSCQCTGERPAWPPGPDDAASWIRYLGHAPDLEPAVRRGADGLAHRVDRLRLCGNGVVPLVAAHALRTLASQLASQISSAGSANTDPIAEPSHP